jgi:DNA-binding MarR family transcriptional regulator
MQAMPHPPKTATQARPDSPLAAEVGALLGQARRTVWAAMAARLESRSEGAHAFQLLSRLARMGSATQVELAEATAQHPAAVSRLLDEVEEAGLVRRTRSRIDRRKQSVALTARGRAKVAELRPEVDQALAEAMGRLDHREQSQLHKLLKKLVGPDAQ